ncbi:hypothetical protein L2E82_01245 [Cichorium intybus]|uniref:Uncharacterized protein n=1 Tax=Cichorium intybus TaxID=13427 RepID=A0ACB9GYR4_CICIN|nr:hypothetical protein L2E82_01245 [Cichorium intybus]
MLKPFSDAITSQPRSQKTKTLILDSREEGKTTREFSQSFISFSDLASLYVQAVVIELLEMMLEQSVALTRAASERLMGESINARENCIIVIKTYGFRSGFLKHPRKLFHVSIQQSVFVSFETLIPQLPDPGADLAGMSTIMGILDQCLAISGRVNLAISH